MFSTELGTPFYIHILAYYHLNRLLETVETLIVETKFSVQNKIFGNDKVLDNF